MGAQRTKLIYVLAAVGVAALLGLPACGASVDGPASQANGSSASAPSQESASAASVASGSSSSSASPFKGSSAPASAKKRAASSGSAVPAKSEEASAESQEKGQEAQKAKPGEQDVSNADEAIADEPAPVPSANEGKKQSNTKQKSKSAASSTSKPNNKTAKKTEEKAAAKSTTKQEPKTDPEPQKKWVDAVYKTVEHPEEGHYEQVVVGERYFCLCGEEVGSPEGWKQHREDFIASNGGKCNGKHVSYTVEDIVEEKYVVDSPAWTEQVLVSEGHWE